jgi:biotin carboxylase
VRLLNQALAGCITIAIASSAYAQQLRESSFTPSEAEVQALVACEEVVLGVQKGDTRIRSGVYDRLYGHWLVVGEKRDEVINCLVVRHSWTALSAPDGRRGARAPR